MLMSSLNHNEQAQTAREQMQGSSHAEYTKYIYIISIYTHAWVGPGFCIDSC